MGWKQKKGYVVSVLQKNLFDFDTPYEEIVPISELLSLGEVLEKMKFYINSKIMNPSDFYYNIAHYREPKIVEKNGLYELRFAISSDSERLLTAYERNSNIKPIELLGVGVAKGALNSIEGYIQDCPNASTLDILNYYRIFNYPTYNFVQAQSDSLDEINDVKKLLIEWGKHREHISDLSETKFSFMRLHKRSKLEDQTNVIPQCFDGLCLEKNMMKILAEVNYANM